MAHIVFSHGKESGPWGGKIRHLAEIAKSLGCTLDSLNYQECVDSEQRVKKLSTHLATLSGAEQAPLVLVGSSMGACVSIAASQRYPVNGLFLLAPAFGFAPGWDVELQPCAGKVEVTHGWHDELIPAEIAFEWCQRYDCTLHVVDDTHRLLGVLPAVGQWFRLFLLDLLRDQ